MGFVTERSVFVLYEKGYDYVYLMIFRKINKKKLMMHIR